MRKLDQLGERNYIRSNSAEQGEHSGEEDRGRKMLSKSEGMMETDVTGTVEETQGDDGKSGGRDTS